jgi:hypothetical protein
MKEQPMKTMMLLTLCLLACEQARDPVALGLVKPGSTVIEAPPGTVTAQRDVSDHPPARLGANSRLGAIDLAELNDLLPAFSGASRRDAPAHPGGAEYLAQTSYCFDGGDADRVASGVGAELSRRGWQNVQVEAAQVSAVEGRYLLRAVAEEGCGSQKVRVAFLVRKLRG